MPGHALWEPRPEVLGNVDARWPGRSQHWDPVAAGRLLEERGFQPRRALGGGRFAVAVVGLWHGERAVARLDPDPACAAAFTAAALLAARSAGPAVHFQGVASGVQVLGCVQPGHSALAEQPDPAALGHLLAGLREGAGASSLPTLFDFLAPRLREAQPADVARASRTFSAKERAAALGLLAELDSTAGLMHGDCSRGNVLKGQGRWWLIDPRGVRGDWQYDVAVAAWKCRYSPAAQKILMRAAGADPDAVAAWGQIARVARV